MNDKSKLIIFGCAVPAVAAFAALLLIGFWFHLHPKTPEKPAFIKEAEPKIEAIFKELENKPPQERKAYDIDQTMMALYSIEKALSEAKNFSDLTQFIVQKESDLVATDAAALKYRFFNVYKNLLESKDKIDEMNSIYSITSGAITDIAGITGADLLSGIRIDKEQARKVWQKRLEEADKFDRIRKRLEEQEDSMIDLLFEYSTVSAKYLGEWNRLCSARDRAYLAFYERDWNEVINSSQAAVAMSPHEKEAHTLLALALIERGRETDAASARPVLEDILKEHNGQYAPALLLKGVLEMKSKDYDKSLIDFDQAAAYYPKQMEELTDTLNLYKKRAYLNNSKEGRVIVNTYRGIMTGAGYFSPDFQKARIYSEKGQKDMARQKLFDHFFRRRLQGQWDKILSDFQFCSNYLEMELPGTMDLSIEPAWLTNSVIVTLNNKGTFDIHNVTLLLCVRFTDMFKGDYISFPVGDPVANLAKGSSVTVGRQNINDVTKESLGSVKKWKDIIEYGAILISDEVITWVPPAPKPPTPPDKPAEKQDISEKAGTIIKDVIDSVVK